MKAIPEGSPVYEDPLVRSALEQLVRIEGEPLDENMVQRMLDEIYDGALGAAWAANVEQHMADFQGNVLDSIMPFRSSDELAAKFDELFDGFQVLPACLEGEYERRKEEDELSAPALLVPITRGQFFAIKPVLKNGTFIANRPYTSLEGLELTGAHSSEGT